MGLKDCFKCRRKRSKYPANSRTTHCETDGNLAVQSPVPSGAEARSNLPPVTHQRMSRPFPDPAETTEPLSSTTTIATRNTTATADPILSQVTPLPLEEDTLSLWLRAYESLRGKEEKLVDDYEKLLSRELGEDDDQAVNRIAADPDERQAQLKSIIDRGLSEADSKQIKWTIFGHEFRLKEQAKQASELIQAVQSVISEALKVSPEASIAWAGVSVLLPLLKNPVAADQANRSGLSYVTSRFSYYMKLEPHLWPQNLRDADLKHEFFSLVVDLYEHILEFQMKTVIRFYSHWLYTIGRDAILLDSWGDMISEIKKREELIEKESHRNEGVAGRYLQEDQLATVKSIKQAVERVPLDLPVANKARWVSSDVEHAPKCLEGTGTRIQETITQWAKAEGDAVEAMLWLVGPAGTGKSTIARTAGDRLASQGQLAAGYFFMRGEDHNDTSRFFPTLADQLARMIPPYRDCLRRSLEGHDKDALRSMGLQSQFDILLGPLAHLPSTTTAQLPWIIIIDALDECQELDNLQRVLNLLLQLHGISQIRLRFLLTSRPDPAIDRVFASLRQNKTARMVELHEDFLQDTKSDIKTFLKARFADIRYQCRIDQNPWPTSEEMNRLVQLATDPAPLFIYAATLCHFIYDEESGKFPKEKLEQWLQGAGDDKLQLDQLYKPIISQALRGNETKGTRVLGVLVLLAAPLPVSSLSDLLGESVDGLMWCLRKLHAVLDIPAQDDGHVRLRHKSFSDFLLNSNDADTAKYRVDAAGTHALLAESCIRRMQAGLKQDICGVGKPDATPAGIGEKAIDRCIPADLQYACLHWAHHLQESGRSLDDHVYSFFFEHFLHWLEALSLLQRIPDGAVAIQRLLVLVNRCSSTPPEFVAFTKDAKRVLSSFGSIIARAPLQVYGSLLFFSPAASNVRQRFWNQRIPRRGRIQGVDSDWGAIIQVLEPHELNVAAVAFSPDGKVLASLIENSVQLWNPDTGAPLHMLNCDRPAAITFSPNGELLAIFSGDKAIRIWNLMTATHQRTLDCHDMAVASIAFSPDGKHILAARMDGTACQWSVNSGSLTRLWTFTNDNETLQKVAFSSDPRLVFAVLEDGTAHFFDMTTDSRACTLQVRLDPEEAFALSPNNQLIAAVSDEHTIRVWNVADGAQKYAISAAAREITFSPDGQLLAAKMKGNDVVTIWDLATGTQLSTSRIWLFYGGLVFSPDSRVLVIPSYSKIHLLDARFPASQESHDGRKGSIEDLNIAPDGKFGACASEDGTISLWDTSTGSRLKTLKGRANSVAFSSDSQSLACYNPEAEVDPITVWDVKSGTCARTISDAYGGVTRTFDYSASGQLVASASSKSNTVRLYDTTNCAHPPRLLPHEGMLIEKVTFSPDGQSLATISADRTVQLWDTRICTLRHTFPEVRTSIFCERIFFSPNSQVIAFETEGCIFCWDIVAEAQYHPLSVPCKNLLAVSPDLRLLVGVPPFTSRYMETLFDATTGEYWDTDLGDTHHATDTIFAPDSQLVALSSSDRTVRLWNTVTRTHLFTLNCPTAHITKLKFSADGKVLVSASRDRTVRLWDTATGGLLQFIQYNDGFLRDISFAPDELVLSLSHDNEPRFWNILNPIGLQVHRYPITTASPRQISEPVLEGPNLDAGEEWIMNGSGNLLWLPQEYRPDWSSAWARSSSAIFIGCGSGRVVRFYTE